MKISTDPCFLQEVMDHPAVRPWIGPDGVEGSWPLAAIFDQGIGIEFEGGGFFFHRLGDGVVEVHTVFLPGTKGVPRFCAQAAEYLFCGTEVTKIVTKVPVDNVPALRLTERVGFRLDYVRPAAFPRGDVLHDVKHYSWDIDLWLRATDGPQWAYERCCAMDNKNKGLRLRYRWAVMNDDYSVLES